KQTYIQFSSQLPPLADGPNTAPKKIIPARTRSIASHRIYQVPSFQGRAAAGHSNASTAAPSIGSRLRSSIGSHNCARLAGRDMAHANPQTHQSRKASSQQRAPALPLPDRDPGRSVCHLAVIVAHAA
ncbi:hypothetical protein KCU71_g23406, partial [Aureobasidium melanogenum]